MQKKKKEEKRLGFQQQYHYTATPAERIGDETEK